MFLSRILDSPPTIDDKAQKTSEKQWSRVLGRTHNVHSNSFISLQRATSNDLSSICSMGHFEPLSLTYFTNGEQKTMFQKLQISGFEQCASKWLKQLPYFQFCHCKSLNLRYVEHFLALNKQSTAVWPDLAEFCRLGIFRGFIVFGKILILLLQKCFHTGKISILAIGQIFYNNIATLVTLVVRSYFSKCLTPYQQEAKIHFSFVL